MKYLYIALGLFFLGMGGVGVVMPFIPTTPFVLLAAVCFGKSSDRLHNWFTSTRLYKNNIKGLVNKKAMTVKAKLILLVSITVFMGLSLFVMRMASAPPLPQIVLAIIWTLHVVYFGFKVKTLSAKIEKPRNH